MHAAAESLKGSTEACVWRADDFLLFLITFLIFVHIFYIVDNRSLL